MTHILYLCCWPFQTVVRREHLLCLLLQHLCNVCKFNRCEGASCLLCWIAVNNKSPHCFHCRTFQSLLKGRQVTKDHSQSNVMLYQLAYTVHICKIYISMSVKLPESVTLNIVVIWVDGCLTFMERMTLFWCWSSAKLRILVRSNSSVVGCWPSEVK